MLNYLFADFPMYLRCPTAQRYFLFADFHMHLMLLHQYASKFLFDFQFALASYNLLSRHFHSHRCYDTTRNL